MDELSSPAPAKAPEERPPPLTLADDAGRWALFLDFDGTLVDLAPSPESIRVPRELPRLLQELSWRFKGALAIFTGRALTDLDRHLGVRFPAAGQHGVQRRFVADTEPWEAPVPPLDRVRRALRELSGAWPGLLVEDKGSTLAVHYRAAPEAGAQVHALFAGIVEDAGRALEIQEGKYVYELRPAGVDKGAALDAFMNTPPFAGRSPLAVGDDVTDENAFAAALKAGGAAVKVGAGASCAQWRLETPRAVRRWLQGMLEAH